MTDRSPFDAERDPELGELVRSAFTGPDSAGFELRLGATLARLPERGSQWDVLAAWARPGVVAAAVAAGFLLGFAVWQAWRARLATPGVPSVAVAMLQPTTRGGEQPIMYAVLEGR